MRYGIICSDVCTEFMLCTHVKSQASRTVMLRIKQILVLCTHVKSQTSRTLPFQSFLSNSLCTYVKSQTSRTLLHLVPGASPLCTHVESQASKTYICGLPIVTVLCTYVKSQAARFSNNIDFGEWSNGPHLSAAKSAGLEKLFFTLYKFPNNSRVFLRIIGPCPFKIFSRYFTGFHE